MQLSKTFCIHAWEHLVHRTDGDLSLCCNFRSNINIKDTSLLTFYNSDYLKDIRKKMLQGDTVTQCQLCYTEEENFNQSIRTLSNNYFKKYYPQKIVNTKNYTGNEEVKLPSRIELHLSNVCNLKCLTCCPQDSSMFLVEENKFRLLKKQNLYNQNLYQKTDLEIEELLSQIKLDETNIIDLRGGESLLVKPIKPFLKNINTQDKKRLTLRIQTNGTIFDNEFIDIFTQFKKVEFLLSIDGYKDDNFYLRYPSNWEKICNTIDTIQSFNNASLHITTTISNLNILVLDKLLDFFIEKNFIFGFSHVHTPKIYKVSNLPKELKLIAYKKLSPYLQKFKNKFYEYEVQNLVNNISYSLELDEFELSDWQQFCEIINFRDKERKENILEYIPEFEKFWIHK